MTISTRHPFSAYAFSAYALLLVVSLSACHRPATTATPYFPPQGNGWARREPANVGMDAARLDSAVAFAKTQETTQMKPDFSTQPGGRSRRNLWEVARSHAH